MGAALLAVGIELLIGIGIGLIVTVIGLFFGNIIVFDSIALAILAGFLSHGLLGVHPALAIVIGITVLLGLLLLHRTRPGFWLIGGVLSVVWGFIFANIIPQVLLWIFFFGHFILQLSTKITYVSFSEKSIFDNNILNNYLQINI